MPDKQIAANNLKQAVELLRHIDIYAWLFLGTALGAYRDKDFCPGDIDDIDLGLFRHDYEKKDRIIKVFTEAGFELEHDWCESDGIAPEMSFIKKYEGWRSKIDLFFITPVGEKMAWRFYSNPIQTRLIDNYFKYLQPIMFYDTLYYIPSPIEEYLAVNYGPNWKTPIPRDQWNWEKDNKCEFKYE